MSDADYDLMPDPGFDDVDVPGPPDMEDEPQPEPKPIPITVEFGYTFHLSMNDAMADAEANPGRVVLQSGKNEPIPWVTCWSAQPLAKFLTRGGHVVWQGVGCRGHWDE